MRLPIR